MAPSELTCDCSETIVKAHTISRSRSLKMISREGFVYAIKTDLVKFNKQGSRFAFALNTIKAASTFRGFCKPHDESIFAYIEKDIFQHDIQSYFLLGYRGLCREIYTNSSSVELGNNPLSKRLKELAAKELYSHKKEHDRILLSKRYDDVRSLVITLDQIPPVMTSFSIYPDIDFSDKIIQDLELANGLELDKIKVKEASDDEIEIDEKFKKIMLKFNSEFFRIPDVINCNSFHDGEVGKIAFTWLKSSENSCIPFIDGLQNISQTDLPAYLLQFFFGYSENCFIDPNWWEALLPKQRTLIENHHNECVKSTKPNYSFFPDWANIPHPNIVKTESIKW